MLDGSVSLCSAKFSRCVTANHISEGLIAQEIKKPATNNRQPVTYK